jgi:hypothetical protein
LLTSAFSLPILLAAMNEEMLAQETCANLLTAAQLKDICRYRGFGSPPGGKDQFAAYIAARFNGSEGVSDAMRSLDETCLAILHAAAMSDDPPTMNDLGGILHPELPYYTRDVRGVFNFIAAGLLNRGVALVHDTGVTRYSGESRYARLTLIIPEAHRPFLPAFPIASEPLGPDSSCADSLSFLRRALASAVERGARPTKERSDGLIERLASLFSFEKGVLTIGENEPSGADAVFREARRLWMHPPSSKQKRDGKAASAAAHILSHLPERRGCTLQALEQGVFRLGLKIGAQDLAQFCVDGWQAGFLARGGVQDNPCYAATPLAGRPTDEPHAFSPDAQGISVDARQTDLEALFEVTRISRAEVSGGRLRLVPDIIRMGRAAARIEASRAIAEVRRLSPAYDSAARHVLERRDKLILHQGLALFRAEDLGLRTQLLHRFSGRIRVLSGPYLASPRELRDDIESFCRKQGFVPRKLP